MGCLDGGVGDAIGGVSWGMKGRKAKRKGGSGSLQIGEANKRRKGG